MNKRKLCLYLTILIIFLSCQDDSDGGGESALSAESGGLDQNITGICGNSVASSNDGQIIYDDNGSSNSLNPLAYQQWYIKNRGGNQNAFSSGNTDGATDLKVQNVHNRLGIKGKGIVVLVADDGLDCHPDINVQLSASRDYANNDKFPDPKDVTGSHGTSVAGIIGMIDNNSIGGVGISPRVEVIGRNTLEIPNDENYTSNYLNSIGVNLSSTGSISCDNSIKQFNIINQSFGSAVPYSGNYDQYDTLNDLFIKVSENCKYIYVKAAGNSFDGINRAGCSRPQAINNSISCDDSSFDPNNTFISNIVVSAVNSSGTLTSYSTTGSAIWVAGTAGEYGNNNNRVQIEILDELDKSNFNKYNFLNFTHQPAMVTTDTRGCTSGYSRKSPYTSYELASASDFNYPWQFYTTPSGEKIVPYYEYFQVITNIYTYDTAVFKTAPSGSSHMENKDCDYTNTFNGTSAAAPAVSGVIALILEAKPTLKWRDVKHILANTSTKINPNHTDVTHSVADDTNPNRNISLVIEKSWFQNTAGYDFSNKYGFGMVNAEASVNMAKSYSANLGTLKNEEKSAASSSTFKDLMTSTPAELSFDYSSIQGQIDMIHFYLTSNHNSVSQLMVKLISPSGTENIIYHPFNSFSTKTYSGDTFENFAIGVNSFYGESLNGSWKIEVYDISNDGVTMSQLSGKLKIYYH